jgi:hypothetical protein
MGLGTPSTASQYPELHFVMSQLSPFHSSISGLFKIQLSVSCMSLPSVSLSVRFTYCISLRRLFPSRPPVLLSLMALVMFRVCCKINNGKNGCNDYILLRKTVPPPPPRRFWESKLMYRKLIIFNTVLFGWLFNKVFPIRSRTQTMEFSFIFSISRLHAVG